MSRREPRTVGSNLAAPYSVAMGLVVASSLGWLAVAVFALLVGPWLGFSFARRTVSGEGEAAA